ncbi:ABC transporter six-transmembrane domain-containing protein [Sessilibacter sp. MAH4]
MVIHLAKNNLSALLFAYLLTFVGYVFAQAYPLVTGIAINGVLSNDYISIIWLIFCHLLMVFFEVIAKLYDTRVYTKIHAVFVTNIVVDSHEKHIDPKLISGRSTLLKEYVSFLERDVPDILLSIVGLFVSIFSIFYIDSTVGTACLCFFVPSMVIAYNLSRKSRVLNQELNNHLESEVSILQEGKPRQVKRHFLLVSKWKIKLSDMEAISYGLSEIFVILLFMLSLWRLSLGNAVEAGTVYTMFVYLWRFVTSFDALPQIAQKISNLQDINRRLRDL